MKYKYFVSYAIPNGFGNIGVAFNHRIGKDKANWLLNLNKEIAKLVGLEKVVVLNYIRVY